MIGAKRLINTKNDARVITFSNREENEHPNCLRLRVGNHIRLIRSQDIVYLQAQSNYTNIYLREGHKICYSRSLKKTLEKIGHHSFIRLHQSFATNKTAVQAIESHDGQLQCILKNTTTLPISRSKRKEVTAWFIHQDENFPLEIRLNIQKQKTM